MIKFLSIGQKIFSLMFSLIVLTLLVVIAITFNESRTSKERFKDEKVAMHQNEFNIVRQLHANHLRLFIENVVNQQPANAQVIASYFDQQFDFLDINELLSQVWVIDANGQVIGENAYSPLPISEQLKTTDNISQQAGHIYCQADCYLYVVVPFLVEDQGQGLIVGAQTLTKLMADLYLTTGATLSQVYMHSSIDVTTQVLHHSATAPSIVNLFAPYLSSLKRRSPQEYLANGIYLEGNGIPSLLSFIELNPQQADSKQYLVFMQNVSEELMSRRVFMFSVILTASVLLVLFSVIFYSFTLKYRRRLSNLVERFPLIKEHRFDEFVDQKLDIKRSFNDELDVLDDAAIELAHELDTMHQRISEDKEQLKQLALYDELTQLANRNKLNEYLRDAISRLRRDKVPFGVLLIDLDDFKKINDGHGHSTGDMLIQEAANRLKNLVREVDLVCRFGGDEFVLVMESIPQTRKANLVAQKVLQCFEAPFEFDGMQFYVTVSLGMTVCNSTVLNADEIIRQADTAMYRAKEVKGNSKYLYDSVLNNEVIRKIELEHEAREALQNDDFYLALQPIIDMKTNYLYGFEALLRWRHPEKGLISPAEFIPILENSSFMLNLDYYVIERSMRVLRYLTTLGYKEQSVAINLSATQFLDPNLKKFLQKMLKKYDIAAHRIELELTETTLVSDTKMTARVMHDLRKVGVKISIDDFGTGYSSLSYLSSMPVSKIKIDRTFVNGLLENSTDSQIVTSTIAMVKNIGMKVVAEGIETIDQYAKLRDLHCDFAQGYFISRPIPEHQLEKGLSEILIEKVWNPSIEHSMGLKYFN